MWNFYCSPFNVFVMSFFVIRIYFELIQVNLLIIKLIYNVILNKGLSQRT